MFGLSIKTESALFICILIHTDTGTPCFRPIILKKMNSSELAVQTIVANRLFEYEDQHSVKVSLSTDVCQKRLSLFFAIDRRLLPAIYSHFVCQQTLSFVKQTGELSMKLAL